MTNEKREFVKFVDLVVTDIKNLTEKIEYCWKPLLKGQISYERRYYQKRLEEDYNERSRLIGKLRTEISNCNLVDDEVRNYINHRLKEIY